MADPDDWKRVMRQSWSWVFWCVPDRYQQKLANPWILPSVNKFLSNITNENWDITPNHSNLVETAHTGHNTEMSTGVALLTRILQAQERDNIIVGELTQFKQNGILHQQFNGMTLESFIPNFGIPPFHSGSRYDLPLLPPPKSPPPSMAHAVPAEPTTTRKCKAKEPEVDERDIIAGGRATHSRVKSQG
ncbi:hypothetical protein DFH08DRAFT_806979 [Mycena albidolilacea]|uniref:Uncharacterized protein n=1 Tax=Mycena albidolilacea TaxID=1033008 RepID=A0AAD7A4Y6_9AGAR|nr:hypothetical protein DFH08DRAFT_806979 [Mycena albidolilacea]